MTTIAAASQLVCDAHANGWRNQNAVRNLCATCIKVCKFVQTTAWTQRKENGITLFDIETKTFSFISSQKFFKKEQIEKRKKTRIKKIEPKNRRLQNFASALETCGDPWRCDLPDTFKFFCEINSKSAVRLLTCEVYW